MINEIGQSSPLESRRSTAASHDLCSVTQLSSARRSSTGLETRVSECCFSPAGVVHISQTVKTVVVEGTRIAGKGGRMGREGPFLPHMPRFDRRTGVAAGFVVVVIWSFAFLGWFIRLDFRCGDLKRPAIGQIG